MLRKLIMFAITSGLAKKAWDHYRARPSMGPRTTYTPPTRPTAANTSDTGRHTRATTAGAGPL